MIQTESKAVLQLGVDSFEREVLQSGETTVVDFYADWCGPCRVVSPIIEKLATEYDGRVKFAKVNTDDNQKLALKYEVMSIPTVMIFKKGRVVERMVGAVPADAYRQRIDAALSKS